MAGQLDQGNFNVLIGQGSRAGLGAGVNNNLLITSGLARIDAKSQSGCLLMSSHSGGILQATAPTPVADIFGVRVNGVNFITQFGVTTAPGQTVTDEMLVFFNDVPYTILLHKI